MGKKERELTIITPTVSRIDYIKRLYKSICETQKSTVHWIIVNDSNPVKELELNKLIKDDRVTVDCIISKGIGKNNAVFKAIEHVKSDYFSIINDKDILTGCICSKISENKLNNNEIAYVLGIETNLKKPKVNKGNLVSSITLIDAYRNGLIHGDKLIIYNTLLSKWMFSESILGEKYFPEDIKHLRAHLSNKKYRFLNYNVLEREYLKGGITDNYDSLISSSPFSFGLYADLTRLTLGKISDTRSLKVLIKSKKISFNLAASPFKMFLHEIISTLLGYILHNKKR